MLRLGFGLSLRDGGGFQCQRVAFLPTGNGGGFLLAVVLFSILLAIDGTPSGLPDDAAFCHELHSGTLCRDGGSVLDAFFGESLKHAPDYHVIDGAVLFGEEQRLLARDEQGMVVCHLAAVQAAACRHGFRLQLVLPFGQAADEGKQLGDFREHVFGNIAASGSRIGDELLLVELLGDFKRLFRREAMLGVGFLLERGQVVQERSFLYLLLAFRFRDGGCACFLYLII